MSTTSDEPGGLTGDGARELERWVGPFERAWEAGRRPDLGAHLPPAGPLRRAVLAELAHADLEYRLKAGEPARVEDYLSRFPELAPDRGLVLRLLGAEYELRRRRQSPPAPDEFLARFPEYAAELAARLDPAPSRGGETAPCPACPHCRGPIDVPPGGSTAVTCPACGSTFPLERAGVADRPAAGAARLGKFELLEVVGRGAFGVVYRARDTELDRVVAVKVPRPGTLAGPDDVDRFLREARSAAQLAHPGIVAVHDAGQSGGTCFVVSEFVPGKTLAEVLRARPPAAPDAARLVAAVADALHYAHGRGVVHRDVKPSNILVAADGTPHLTDFGLARRDAGEVSVTLDGQVLGTPAYMSPEQARGEAHRVDGRGDVYSLGAVLYELLTGERPFRGTTRMLLHQVLHDEPRPPRKLNDKVPRDLETICLKAMAKEPARRYPTAGELADDLRRFLKGEPVQARPVGWAERLGRWCRRNPALAAASGLAAVFLLAVAAVSTAFALREGANAQQLRDQAGRLAGALTDARGNLRKAEDNRRQAEYRLAENELEKGQAFCREHDTGVGTLWLARALETASRAEADDLDQVIRANLGSWRGRLGPLRATLPHLGPVGSVAFSPDGRWVVTGGNEGAFLWRLLLDQSPGTLLPHPRAVTAVAFSPDGRTVLTGCADNNARLWDVATGRTIGPPLPHDDSVRAVAFSPDGRTALTGGRDNKARLWDAATGRPRGPVLEHPGWVTGVAFSPDGRLAVTCANDTAWLWDTDTGKPVRSLRPGGSVLTAVFSPDGQTLLTATGAEARLWHAGTLRPRGPALPHQSSVLAVAFSPDGATVATASQDATARLWETATGRPVGAVLHHDGPVRAVAFAPDGRAVATAGWPNRARVWDVGASPAPPLRLPHPNEVLAAVFSPDGRRVLTAGRDGKGRFWDAATGKPLGPELPHRAPVLAAAFSPDGQTVLSAAEDGGAQLWDAGTGRPLGPPLPHPGPVFYLAFSPDGTRAVTGGQDPAARVWDTATGRPVGTPLAHQRRILAVAFSPDGRTVATGSDDFRACLWEAATGRQVGPPLVHRSEVYVVAFRPDGRALLTGTDDGTARLWDAATGEPLDVPALRHETRVERAAFSRDGRTVVTASNDRTARLWDAATGKPLGPPLAHPGFLRAAAFGPDGRSVVTASHDGTVQRWHVPTGKPLGEPFLHPREVYYVATFSPDGRTVLTASADNNAWLWPVPPPVEGDVGRIVLWSQAATGLELDERGAVHVLDDAAWHERLRRLEAVGGPPP